MFYGGVLILGASHIWSSEEKIIGRSLTHANKAPLYTKLTLMDCGIGNTNLLGPSSSGLGYDCFYMKSTDGAAMYFNLGSGIGSGRFQTDYWVKLRKKDEK